MKMILATGLMALSAFTAAHSATVVNGNFELGIVNTVYTGGAGFMTDGLFGTTTNGYNNTPDGITAGYLNSSYSFFGGTTGAIQLQLQGLIVGQSYSINFANALSTSAAYAANPFTVSYNNTQIGSFAATSTNWTTGTTGVFAATGTTGTLTFTGSTLPGIGLVRSVGIDGVSISDVASSAPVPEPASWAMMIGGFGMVGGALRRRRAVLNLA